MNKVAALTVSILLFSCPAVFGQDAMQYGLKHLTVLAEDQKVRVLRYAPRKGDKTPIHSHPEAVVYVLKGGRVKYTMPDGSTKISELKTGETLIRPPVTHTDEALDDVEAILIEIKQ
jgi:quercetin dioxygenase-like cupin family protein